MPANDTGSDSFLKKATDFFEVSVVPWWTQWCAKHPQLSPFALPILLSGIFLQLQRLLMASQQGSNYFRINPYVVVASAAPQKILQKEPQARTRNVSVWVDSAVGGPLPVLRISTGATGTGGGGVRVTPGQPNELGMIPGDVELWAASDTTINLYVIERA